MLRSFAQRTSETELMDTETVPPEDFARCLGDLAVVNRITLAHRPTLSWLARAVGDAAGFSVLDVGFGHGDMLRAIARWAARRGKTARLSGVDLDPSSEPAARAATPRDMRIDYRTGDVFAFRPSAPPDFVISSLFTHHLPDARIVDFIRWMEATAVRGWFINDLHRHAVAYHGFRAMAAVSGWHRFVRHDGAVSIARAFRRADWEGYLAKAGVSASIAWKTPFRLCVARIK